MICQQNLPHEGEPTQELQSVNIPYLFVLHLSSSMKCLHVTRVVFPMLRKRNLQIGEK